ncbi:MAG TPA: anti-sigma factor [Verrucomicrobiae bacterium]|nr:anti-sigma factor [Verrucomicrobiae bacterium]
MDHAQIKELIPLKALSRLEGDEARAVDEHLAAGCDECERELASFNEALAAMAIAEDSGGEDSSQRIWSRLQARLTDDPRTSDRAARRVEDRAVRQPSRRSGLAMLGSAAVAAVVAIAVSAVFYNSRVRTITTDTSDEITALTAKVILLQRNVDTTGDQLAALQAKVAQTTDLTLASVSPDARVVRLSGLAASPSASGTVAFSHAQGTAILEVSGLPPTPDDKEYEVWWIGEKQGPLKAGLFEPANQGATIVSLDLPPPGEVVLASAVTLEPLGGVDKPSGAMYLKGDFARH